MGYTFDVSNNTFNVFNADNLTDVIVCLKNGNRRGTNSWKFTLTGRTLTVISDDSKFITLLVDDVRSSNSNKMSHNIVRIFGT